MLNNVSALAQYDDRIRRGQILKLVGDKHPGLPVQQSGDALVHQMPADVSINGRKRIVQQIYVSILVASASEGNAMPLSPAEIDAFLSDLGQIARRQDPQVGFQGASAYHALVPFMVEFTPEKYIIPHRHVLDPRVLLCIRDGSIDLHHGRVPSRPHLAQNSLQ